MPVTKRNPPPRGHDGPQPIHQTYLIEVDEWTGAEVGAFALYASTDPEYFRMGEVSAEHAGLSPADCASGDIPTVRIDGSEVYTTNEPVACLRVDETQRLALKAVSFTGQDLTLEVIGFTADGTPFRFVWVDDDLWASDWRAPLHHRSPVLASFIGPNAEN